MKANANGHKRHDSARERETCATDQPGEMSTTGCYTTPGDKGGQQKENRARVGTPKDEDTAKRDQTCRCEPATTTPDRLDSTRKMNLGAQEDVHGAADKKVNLPEPLERGSPRAREPPNSTEYKAVQHDPGQFEAE